MHAKQQYKNTQGIQNEGVTMKSKKLASCKLCGKPAPLTTYFIDEICDKCFSNLSALCTKSAKLMKQCESTNCNDCTNNNKKIFKNLIRLDQLP